MSKVALSLKINLNQMDTARLFQGQKGQYLDATIFVDLDQFDQYGNSGMITQDVTKEEKAAGVKGNILGNGKIFWKEGGNQQAAPQQAYIPPAPQQPAPQMAPAYQPQQAPAPQQLTQQLTQQQLQQAQAMSAAQQGK